MHFDCLLLFKFLINIYDEYKSTDSSSKWRSENEQKNICLMCTLWLNDFAYRPKGHSFNSQEHNTCYTTIGHRHMRKTIVL